MPTRPQSSAEAGRKRARTRRLATAAALASGLLLLGQAVSGSAEPGDDAVEVDALNPLVAQALDQGVLDVADLQVQAGEVSLAAVPTVTAVLPLTGPLTGGTIIVLTGTGFVGTTGTIDFATGAGTQETIASTNYAVVSDTRIVAKTSVSSAAGARTVKVTNGSGTNTTSTQSFTYTGPTITSVTPAFADPTASKIVTINGTGFTGALAADVKFDTIAALRVWVVSDTQIIAETPIDVVSPAVDVPDGVVDVTVTRNSVVSTTAAASKFLFSSAAPAISALGASGTDAAAVASTLTITGTKLWGVTKVNFGSTVVTTAADIVVASNGNSMTVKVPARTTMGPVDLTVENVIGVSVTNLATRFNYIGTVAPTITSVSPNVLDKSANATSTFLVAGTGFSGSSTSKVTFKCAADVTPTSVTVVSDTSLIVTYKVGGTAATAESCGLEIVNAADSTKKVTMANALRFV